MFDRYAIEMIDFQHILVTLFDTRSICDVPLEFPLEFTGQLINLPINIHNSACVFDFSDLPICSILFPDLPSVPNVPDVP